MPTSKLAFIGRVPHEKTKSDVFLIDLLKKRFDVSVFRKEAMEDAKLVKEIQQGGYERVIFYQLPPSLTRHLRPLKSKKLFWVPMFDGFQKPSWKKRLGYRYYNLKVISFCKKVHQSILSSGLESLYCQYFPKGEIPKRKRIFSDKCSIFFWQRTQAITLKELVAFFGAEKIKKVIYKSDFSLDENNYPFEIEKLSSWMPRNEYLNKLYEADYYFAPRLEEGIGFSFLEAMARGLIVVGHDSATMNEYIEDGKNGYLFSLGSSKRKDLKAPAQVLSDLESYCQRAYLSWLSYQQEILDYLSS